MELLKTLWEIPQINQLGTTILIGAMYTYIFNEMALKFKNRKRSEK